MLYGPEVPGFACYSLGGFLDLLPALSIHVFLFTGRGHCKTPLCG